MNNTLRFLLNGTTIESADVNPHLSLLDFLREQKRLTGCKEGCAEGDCGACTVVVGELMADAAGRDRVRLMPINACIRLLPTLDGKAVFTVEALKAGDGSLHPVQQAMVDCHGSQCGFCTPGFVMSLFALFKTEAAPTRTQTCEALSGNLCRCTGYRPILDAAQVMYRYASESQIEHSGSSARWLCTAATEQADPLPGEMQVAAQLRTLVRSETLHCSSTGGNFIAPRTVADFSSAVLAHPDAWIVAGGTDVGLWINKALQTSATLIYTGEVTELRQITDLPTGVRVGAAVTLEAAFQALNSRYPELAHVWTRFASKPIRSSGTLGGNVANGSPIGDSMPALIVLGAQVLLRKGERQRTLPLEALYLDYKQQAREPGEWVEAVIVSDRPLLTASDKGMFYVACYKNSKRNEQDISAVLAAFALTVRDGCVSQVRIAYGGMAGTPKRAAATETLLLGRQWNEETVRSAMVALGTDYQPMTDMRASAGYRMQVAQNLLLRFWHETSGQIAEVRVL